ncbi:MAG: hypothetical protein KGM24_08870 [Elusimicrobia bacterium]|nr:hypothetical protein [Elusimicrobiota bacterium]
MKRLAVASAAAVIAAAALWSGREFVRLDRLADTPPPDRATAAQVAADLPGKTLDSAVSSFLADSGDPASPERLIELGELAAKLDAPELAGADLEPEAAQALGESVGAILSHDPDDSPDGLELRRRAVRLLATRDPAPSSRDAVLRVLDDGPQVLRDEALGDVGSPRGVRGPAVYEKVLALSGKGLVPPDLLPEALRRTGGRKARPVLLGLLKSTDSFTLVSGCAVALQDYRDPDLVGGVLERLEAVGRLQPGKMPWLSAGLLERYLKTADRDGLRRGLTAMAVRPSLARVAPLQRGLDSADPATRRAAAQAVKKAVVAGTIPADQGEEMLAGRLKTETEPALKAELTASLVRVQGLLPPSTRQ